MNFVNLLNHYVENTEISNNTIINYSGIDRSTFYKILKGTRYPTEKQLKSIIDVLNISTSEKYELMDLYEKNVYSEEKLHEKEFVMGIFDILHSSDFSGDDVSMSINYTGDTTENVKTVTGISAIKKCLKSEITKELLCNKNELDISASLEMLIKLGVFDMLQFINSDVSSRDTLIRHLVEISTDNLFKQEIKLDVVKSYLMFILGQNLNYEAKYYRSNGNLSSQLGVLYPYYIITTESVLLISKDGTSLIRLDDKEQINAFKEGFDDVIEDSEYLLSKFDTKEEYVDLLGQRGDKVIYIFEKRPGLSFMATDDFINKYVPDELKEFVKYHTGCFIDHPHVEINSDEGLMEFMNTPFIEEAGFKLEKRQEDIGDALKLMQTRLHNTLEIVDSKSIPLSDNWTVTIVENEYLILVPYLTNDKIVFVPDKKIAGVFTDFVKKLGDFGFLLESMPMLE